MICVSEKSGGFTRPQQVVRCRITRNALTQHQFLPTKSTKRRIGPSSKEMIRAGLELPKAGSESPPQIVSGSVSLEEYSRFHGMLIDPRAAKRCIDSINGHVLFMPSTYRRNPCGFPSASGRLSPWDCRRALNTITYYLLVLWSFTGLSSLIGATKTIDAREATVLSKEGGIQHPNKFGPGDLKGTLNPSLHVDSLVLRYLTKPLNGLAQPSSVRMVRRFEYNFRAAGWSVMMLHFVSLNEAGKIMRDKNGRQILHLVEVYERGWVFHAWLAAIAAVLLRVLIAITAQL